MGKGDEEEIYSIMFKSLKHPVRRRILRMLNDKPMTFMELAEQLGVASNHLTYHLDSLRELLAKTDTNQYRLSSFGKATVTAMKGVEEAPELETRRRPKKLARKWKAAFAALMVCVLVLSSFGVYQYTVMSQLALEQQSLEAENQQLLSWGIGAGKAADLLRDVVGLDTNRYKITLESNTLEYRDDFTVAEEVLRYHLENQQGNLDVSLRFRENHLSRYQLTANSAPQLKEKTPSDILDAAKAALDRYKTYSGDGYLDEMTRLLAQVNATQSSVTAVSEGNMKLQITTVGSSVEFLWMYAQGDVDYAAKSLRMTFENRVLTAVTDGYFLFTISNATVNFDSAQAQEIAQNYVKTMTWTINGTEVSGFAAKSVVSVEMLPHPQGNSVALVPYWYVVVNLDKMYSGGLNMAAVGVWADTGKVADVQLLSG